MKNFNLIDETVIQYYDQFKDLGELREDESIDYKFLKEARTFFSKQYFFELRLIIKAENRQIKRDFKLNKRTEIKQAKALAKQKKEALKKEVSSLKAVKKVDKNQVKEFRKKAKAIKKNDK